MDIVVHVGLTSLYKGLLKPEKIQDEIWIVITIIIITIIISWHVWGKNGKEQ